MSFLNLPWKWDYSEVPSLPVGLAIRRWRRGPVTFYRHVIHCPNKADPNATYTSFWLCLANDVSLGIHLPARWGFGPTGVAE